MNNKQKIIDVLPEGIYQIDLSGKFIYVNKAFLDIFGYEKEEMLGKNFSIIVTPTKLNEAKNLFCELLSGKPVKAELDVVKKNGVVITSFFSAIPLIENDKVIGLSGVLRNISYENKMREALMDGDRRLQMISQQLMMTNQELEESESKYRSIIENATDQIFLIDKDYKYVSVNKPVMDGFRKEKEEIIGKSVSEVVSKEIALQFMQNLKKVFASGKSFFTEEYVNLPNHEIWASTSLNPVKNSKGEVVYVMGVVRDITEKKRMEENLRKIQEEQHTLLNSVPAWIFYKDKENRFIRVNKAFADVMKMSSEELEGKTLWDLYPKEQADAYWKDDKAVMISGKPKTNIVESMKSPNGTVWVKTDKIPYRDPSGQVVGIIGFAIDITEQKKTWEKYELLFKTSNDAIMTLEPPSWNFTSGNPAAIKMFNLENEKQFVSLKPYDLSPEKQPDGQLSSEKAKKMIKKAMKEGSNFFEWTHKRYGGEDFFATVLLSRVEEGKKTYLQATVRDLTIQKNEQLK